MPSFAPIVKTVVSLVVILFFLNLVFAANEIYPAQILMDFWYAYRFHIFAVPAITGLAHVVVRLRSTVRAKDDSIVDLQTRLSAAQAATTAPAQPALLVAQATQTLEVEAPVEQTNDAHERQPQYTHYAQDEINHWQRRFHKEQEEVIRLQTVMATYLRPKGVMFAEERTPKVTQLETNLVVAVGEIEYLRKKNDRLERQTQMELAGGDVTIPILREKLAASESREADNAKEVAEYAKKAAEDAKTIDQLQRRLDLALKQSRLLGDGAKGLDKRLQERNQEYENLSNRHVKREKECEAAIRSVTGATKVIEDLKHKNKNEEEAHKKTKGSLIEMTAAFEKLKEAKKHEERDLKKVQASLLQAGAELQVLKKQKENGAISALTTPRRGDSFPLPKQTGLAFKRPKSPSLTPNAAAKCSQQQWQIIESIAKLLDIPYAGQSLEALKIAIESRITLLRGKKSTPVKPKESEEFERMKEQLRKTNIFLLKHKIDVKVEKIAGLVSMEFPEGVWQAMK